ncbi:hypothetical protein [Burkholderia sp. AU32262]|uniref:hypothetical protein n=1 Tax=Burkholderia sp. AU32262 TaxID=2879630 RepID=UPI001CF4A3DD|nr:hypothetical protein [Burkholderia sp. AU32262]MCA8239866.1 hypothetical protein [Burkholderia sp. AU32262]
MSDINAAPSSTEPSNEAEKTDMQGDGVAVAGETTGIQAIPSDSGSNASTAESNITSTTVSTDDADGATGTTSTDAPAVAAVGEASAADAQPSALVPAVPGALSAQPVSDAQVSVGSGDAVQGDDPNAAASPAAEQSASDTASSAQDASQGDGTEVAALHAELDDAYARLAVLQRQLAAAQEAQVRAELPPAAAHPAKEHATSLLQKIEAGEAIVLGDLQAKLRAFVEAL